jgi:hypothetical protein
MEDAWFQSQTGLLGILVFLLSVLGSQTEVLLRALRIHTHIYTHTYMYIYMHIHDLVTCKKKYIYIHARTHTHTQRMFILLVR